MERRRERGTDRLMKTRIKERMGRGRLEGPGGDRHDGGTDGEMEE